MMKNACAILMCSRGIPMFLAGDEFGNTQFGNNNPYCQDNEISWLNWEYLKKNEELFEFFKQMIQFRKEHPILRKDLSSGIYEFPDISFHGVTAWDDEYREYDRYVGVMFAGKEESDRPDIIYIASNSYWKELEVELPQLPKNVKWVLKINTSENKKTYAKSHYKKFIINSRTVMVFIAQIC